MKVPTGPAREPRNVPATIIPAPSLNSATKLFNRKSSSWSIAYLVASSSTLSFMSSAWISFLMYIKPGFISSLKTGFFWRSTKCSTVLVSSCSYSFRNAGFSETEFKKDLKSSSFCFFSISSTSIPSSAERSSEYFVQQIGFEKSCLSFEN